LFAALHQEDLPELISSSDPSDDEAYFEYEDGFLGALPQSPWGWKFDDGSGEWLPGIGLRQRWKSRDKELSPKPAEYRRRPSPLPQAQQAPQALAAYHSQEAVAARHTGRIAPIAHIAPVAPVAPVTLAAPDPHTIFMVVDTGSTHFIFNGSKHAMTDYVSQGTRVGTVSDKNGLSAVGVGTLPLTLTSSSGAHMDIDFSKVLHAPSATHSLISISSIREKKICLQIDEDLAGIFINDDKGVERFFEAKEVGGLFFLTGTLRLRPFPGPIALAGTAAHVAAPDSRIHKMAKVVHESCGHMHWKKIIQGIKSGTIKTICSFTAAQLNELLPIKNFFCVSCNKYKKVLNSQPAKSAKPTVYQKWEHLEIDNCGPFPGQRGGHSNICVAVEAATNTGILFKRGTLNGEDSAQIIETIDNTARKTTEGARSIRTDLGTDWTSNRVAGVLAARGITPQRVTKDGHGGIGKVERRMRTLQERALCQLDHCSNDDQKREWLMFSIEYINFIDNWNSMLPVPRAEQLTGTTNPCRFLPFGCRASTVAPRRKGNGRSQSYGYHEEFVFVGCSTMHKGGYKFYNQETDKVVVRGDVHSISFFVDQFPWKTEQARMEPREPFPGPIMDLPRPPPSAPVAFPSPISSASSSVASTPSVFPSPVSDAASSVASTPSSVHPVDPLSDISSRQPLSQVAVDDNMDSSDPRTENILQSFEQISIDDEMNDSSHERLQDEYAGRAFCGVTIGPADVSPQPCSERRIPKSIKDGFQDPERKQALVKEFMAHVNNHTFVMVDNPNYGPDADPDNKMHIMRMHMLQSDKIDEKGNVSLAKARMVVDGSTQDKTGMSFEKYAPNLTKESFKLLCKMAVQQAKVLRGLDVVSAFLLTTLAVGEVYYCYPPPGFELLCAEAGIPSRRGQVLMLKSAVYGLKSGSHDWHSCLTDWLFEYGFVRTTMDPCLFRHADLDLWLGIHTDDGCLVGELPNTDAFVKAISEKFPIKDLGFPKLWCGIQVIRISDTEIHLSNSVYARKMVQKFWDGTAIHGLRSPCPMKDLEPTDPLIQDTVPFRELNGCLLWLTVNTRFDLAKAVNQVSRFASAPTVRSWKAMKRIVRYVAATEDFVLVIKQDPSGDLPLTCSADGSWAPNLFRDSVGGFLWFLGSTLICWKCQISKNITLSTCETELVYVFKGARAGAWLIPLVRAMFRDSIPMPCVIYNDNEGAIALAVEGRYSQNSRHVQVKYMFTHNLIKAGLITVKWMSTHTLHADILTKAFHPSIWSAKLGLFNGSFKCPGLLLSHK